MAELRLKAWRNRRPSGHTRLSRRQFSRAVDIFLVIEAVAVIVVRVWSPCWCDWQILALTAGAPFSRTADTPSPSTQPSLRAMIVARISNVAFAALALAAVWIAARRLATANAA
jgi:hypothetical protein